VTSTSCDRWRYQNNAALGAPDGQRSNHAHHQQTQPVDRVQGVTVRAVVTKASVAFDGDSANRQGGNEMVDQHAGEHVHHKRHNLIGTPQQDVYRVVYAFGDGYGFHTDLREE